MMILQMQLDSIGQALRALVLEKRRNELDPIRGTTGRWI